MNAKLVGIVLLAGCVADAGASKQVRCIDETEAVKASLGHQHDGEAAFQRREYEAAIGHLQQAVEAERRNHVAWFQLGVVHDARHAYDEAVKAYEQATSLAPGEAIYWLKLGLARHEEGLANDQVGLPAVTQALHQALELNPRFYRAHHTLGMIAVDAQAPTEAAEAFTRAIEAAPHVPASYVALGELYLAWGFAAEAVKLLATGDARVAGADRATVRLALGRAYRDAGDAPHAIEALTGALEDQPTLHEARFERGMAYVSSKELAKARQDLEEFVKAGSRVGVAWDIAQATLAGVP